MNKIIVIIISVLLIGVVGFVFYTYKNQTSDSQKNREEQILTPEEKETVIQSLSAPATSTQTKKVDDKVIQSLSAPTDTSKPMPSQSDEEQRKILESLQAK